MTISYPVAATADAALASPEGVAEREKAAAALAGGPVLFAVEAVGPVYASREALQESQGAALAKSYVQVRPVLPGPRREPPARPANADGRRWPRERAVPPPHWRLSISYWKILGSAPQPSLPARTLRTRPDGEGLTAEELAALSRQPLQPIQPQRALDIGLFEIRPPDAPHLLIPDE